MKHELLTDEERSVSEGMSIPSALISWSIEHRPHDHELVMEHELI